MAKDADLIIIGGGPAGLSAAIQASSEGLFTRVIESKKQLGGQAGTSAKIMNFLGHPEGISGRELAIIAERQARRFKTNFSHGKVVAIHKDKQRILVQLSEGEVSACKALLIATGVQYNKLNIPGIDNFGVFYGSHPQHAKQWKGKGVAIVGGANSAGQAAVHHSKFCNVVMLVRHKLNMSAYLEKEIAARKNIEVRTGVELKEIEPGPRLHLTDGSMVNVGGLFIFIGANPYTEWCPLEKDEKGFLCTGKEDRFGMESSIRGIFVAGDVRMGSMKRVASAVGDGAVAVGEIHRYLASGAK